MIKAIDTKGLTPEQVLSESEEGMIDSAKHLELRIMQNKLLNLEPFEQEIGDRLFKYRGDTKKNLIISNEIKKELEALGFEEEWIASPVLLDSGGEVYAGDYDGEPITYEFFYERLKSVMGETEDC